MSETKNVATCPNCGNEYTQIGNHWAASTSCDYPTIPDEKKEILVGLLMGDGTINKSSKNASMQVGSIEGEFLEWVHSELGWVSSYMDLRQTREELVEAAESNEYVTIVNGGENWSDFYYLQTRAHPFFTELYNWYESGSKVWPKDLELTPNTLLMWYVGDGHYARGEGVITIGISNEFENKEKLNLMFENVGLPKPPNYKNGAIKWWGSTSDELIKYMQKSDFKTPPPGFEYKFPMEMGGV